jgi:hypothetical protein
MRKVYRKSDLSEIKKRIDVCRRDVQFFYVADIAIDSRLGLVITRLKHHPPSFDYHK